MSPDQLAELEEERGFLLRSLDDLEREVEAGDVDDHDYQVLRDGYTARAASVLRSIDAGKATLPAKRERRRLATMAWVVGVVVFAGMSGWLLARSSGQRIAGQTLTGGQPISDITLKLTQARGLMQAGDFGGAFEAFRAVSEIDPNNVEALTYSSWIVVLNTRTAEEPQVSLMLDAAFVGFQRAIEIDDGYADAHCLYAVTASRFAVDPDLERARQEAAACLASNPPTEMRGFIEESLADLLPSSTGTGTGE